MALGTFFYAKLYLMVYTTNVRLQLSVPVYGNLFDSPANRKSPRAYRWWSGRRMVSIPIMEFRKGSHQLHVMQDLQHPSLPNLVLSCRWWSDWIVGSRSI